jgi:putative SOS response-associated peptidase YedK
VCGRFGISTDIEELQDFFVFDPASVSYVKRYNVAPTDPVLTYGAMGMGTAELMRWGLIPWWSRLGGRKLPLAINARAESLTTNGMFKEAFERRRCLVIADGYYEWRKNADGSATPFRIGMKDWTPFGIAAIWDSWHGPNGLVRSCSIITTLPNELNAAVHDRMPAILPCDTHTTWLGHAPHDTDALRKLLVPYATDAMTMYEISPAIGSVKNDYPALIEPVSQGSLF